MNVLWGIIIVICGVFVCVYGNLLFRFTLAALGFGIGAILGWWLAGGQSDMMRLLISLALGGIGALLLYFLFQIGIYVAGGVLGLVVAFLLVALLGLGDSWLALLFLVAGTGVVGFFARKFERWIIPLATAAAGAFQVVYGLALIFVGQISQGSTPMQLLGQPLALAVFLVVAAVSFLSQIRPRAVMVRSGGFASR
jgi:hypothetical protein